jgi:hypothetical protein
LAPAPPASALYLSSAAANTDSSHAYADWLRCALLLLSCPGGKLLQVSAAAMATAVAATLLLLLLLLQGLTVSSGSRRCLTASATGRAAAHNTADKALQQCYKEQSSMMGCGERCDMTAI